VRLLMIAPEPFFTPRGTPLSVYHRTAALAELGVSVDLLTYGQGLDVDVPGVRILRIPSFRWLGEVPTGPSVLKAFLDVFLVLWAVALLVRHSYDAVHAHEEAVFFCLALRPFFGFKLVYDMHSSLPQQLENFRFTKLRLWVKLFDALERRAVRRADAVITICPELARHALEVGVPPGRHFLIENSLLDPVRLSIPEADPVVQADRLLAELPEGAELLVYAGTLEAYQGTPLLLRALAELAPRAPRAFLLVLGGTREQVARYRALAGELGVAARCHFQGRVPQQTARGCIAAARLQVSPRTEGTNTPLKVYEQLDSGVALVATDVPSHTQVLDDEVALLAAPEPAALADALARALADPELRRRIAAAAKRRYETRYARRLYLEKLRSLLEGLA
jgi:glycosyltransferase involved in cell wall biosynthesis